MKADKDLYRQLRALSAAQLWNDEVPRFDKASPEERMRSVAVIRAVGVAFQGCGTAQQKADVRAWLVRLLKDPSEKVRRYAMAAMPKIGAGAAGERELIAILKATEVDRERKFVGRALDKVGGRATLDLVADQPGLLPQTEQKVRASVARREQASAIRMNQPIAGLKNVLVHLRCRRGLEDILRQEVEEHLAARKNFRTAGVRSGCVAVAPVAPFTLNDLYALRCFATAGVVLATVGGSDDSGAIAAAIASPLSLRLLSALTSGPIRYRLEFISRGHRRGAVRTVANKAYALCPRILNDSRTAPWSVDVHPSSRGWTVELRPRLHPDPRMFYRTDDVAAASHPPLAACMARLAGMAGDEVVWDPFCGSGLELVERALRGGVRCLYGTDLSREAIAIAQANLRAAGLAGVRSTLACCDFRDFGKVAGLGPETVTLVVTNPPMGRRIRIPDMRGLIADLFIVAAKVLKPGGRLVFVNPLKIEPAGSTLRLQYRQAVDLGGFDCRLEMYEKAGKARPTRDRDRSATSTTALDLIALDGHGGARYATGVEGAGRRTWPA